MTDTTKTDVAEQAKSFIEQREHARVSVVYSGKIFVGPKEIDCTIFNISAGGAKVYVKSPLEHAAVVTLKIDRFGNIVTNFPSADFPQLERSHFTILIGPAEITVMARTYAETGPGELFAIAGSSGYIEISIAQGSAARKIGCGVGGPAELKILSAG